MHNGILAVAVMVMAALANAGGAAQTASYPVAGSAAGRHAGGTIAFVDMLGGRRIVEIDRAGRVVWQWRIPSAVLGGGDLSAGADLEWVASDDSFLLVVPFRGIFRVSRNGEILWRHLTGKVSHDADLLPNGNVLYVFGWDGDGDDQVTEVAPDGRIVWSWRARGRIDPSWRDVRQRERRYSFTHANAVQRLPNGDTLVSLRNMHRAVIVAPDGTVKRAFGPLPGLHDPVMLPGRRLLVARHAPPPNVVLEIAPPRQRNMVFANPIDLRPIRTVQPLPGGTILLTGGDAIVEIDGRGDIVWQARIYSGLGADRLQTGVYKAVHIPD